MGSKRTLPWRGCSSSYGLSCAEWLLGDGLGESKGLGMDMRIRGGVGLMRVARGLLTRVLEPAVEELEDLRMKSVRYELG